MSRHQEAAGVPDHEVNDRTIKGACNRFLADRDSSFDPHYHRTNIRKHIPLSSSRESEPFPKDNERSSLAQTLNDGSTEDSPI